VTGIDESWWYGNVQGRGKKGYFPCKCVKLHECPVARFDLVGIPEDKEKPMTAVVMLMQANALMKRRFKKWKDTSLNYKDVTYPGIQLYIIGPDGKIALKKQGKRRCIYVETKMPGNGRWRIYALPMDGQEDVDAFTLRVYVKDGTARLREIKKANYTEITAAINGQPPPPNALLPFPEPVQPGQLAEPEGEEDELDETGIESQDIEFVISQVNCSRAQAVHALRSNNNDIVEAMVRLA